LLIYLEITILASKTSTSPSTIIRPEIILNNFSTLAQKINPLSREIMTGLLKDDEVSTVEVPNSVDVDQDQIERRVLRKIDLR
jgi:hypothetical protein